ncbi:hypothetical protein B0T17DRAFT_501953 [Bombardia bombarda]|uniref:Uncharacterized protein n=1 Tax=Bombardia bombarda TaxID=252184 RepID=A0AA39XIM2_9PEZI|nr:hypothetical protein B0T17DRAFT_501953 [Bombardia bombarda]
MGYILIPPHPDRLGLGSNRSKQILLLDDYNRKLALEVKWSNYKARQRHQVLRFLSFGLLRTPCKTLPVPKVQPLDWGFVNNIFPHSWDSKLKQGKVPWWIRFTCELEDAGEQLDVDASTAAGRRRRRVVASVATAARAIGPGTAELSSRSSMSGGLPAALAGRWLVTVNIYADDRQWVENVDVRDLVSWGPNRYG